MPPLRHIVGEKNNFVILLAVDLALLICLIVSITAMVVLSAKGRAWDDPLMVILYDFSKHSMGVFAIITWVLRSTQAWKKIRETNHTIVNQNEGLIRHAEATGKVADTLLEKAEHIERKADVAAEKAEVAAEKAVEVAQKSDGNLAQIVATVAEKVKQAKNEPCPEQEAMPKDVRELYRFVKLATRATVDEILANKEFTQTFAKQVCPEIAKEIVRAQAAQKKD
jgi:hypothetical protein